MNKRNQIDCVKVIIDQLSCIKYNNGDIGDIGNEIGIAIEKYRMGTDPGKHDEHWGWEISDFISGVNHGVSLIDGSH